jgi:hypothetical protein
LKTLLSFGRYVSPDFPTNEEKGKAIEIVANEEKGKAIEIVAKKVGLSHITP